MHTLFSMIKQYSLYACIVMAFAVLGCSEKQDVQEQQKELIDEPLALYQGQLLDMAMDVATAIPVQPHIKDRSKAQEAVIEACLELDQPKRALAYIEKIENWRRNLCYANLAYYCARHGCPDDAKAYLDIAGQYPKEKQEWRINRIKTQIAKTRTVLGQNKQARQIRKDLADSPEDEKAQAQGQIGGDKSFEDQLKALDALVKVGGFDPLQVAVRAYAQLFNRYYDDTAKRDRIEEKLKIAWKQLPVAIRMEVIIELAEFALNHRDAEKALKLVDEGQAFIDGSEWPLEYHVAFMGQLIELRFRAGDMEQAKADAAEALALFNKKRKGIVDIYRAAALRPLAQAYHVIGDTNAALDVYKQVVEEGMGNPNSRPRAEDLSATCSSMALYNVEPDESLWARIKEIRDGLSDPW